MKLWILHITHRHGDDLMAFKSKEGADRALSDYVKEWWAQEIGSKVAMPSDVDEMITQYFELVGEESHHLQECELRD